jgi:hypothetical protein
MRKVSVFTCLLLAVFFPAVLTGAQQPKKLVWIGYLSSLDGVSESARSGGFDWFCASSAT